MRSVRIALIACAAPLSPCASAGDAVNTALGAPPVFSESFEAPVTKNYTVVRAGQSFDTQRNAWRVTDGSIDIVNTSVRREAAAIDGKQAIDLAGSPGAGVVSTSFPTTRGQQYTLSFHYARNNGSGKGASARVEAIGAETLLRSDLQHAPPLPYNALQRFSMSFVADSPTTTLRFTSLTSGNYGVILDAITVAAGAEAAAPPVRDLSGEYVYLGRGSCSLTQLGVNVHMFCTWAPAGRGPHYEIRGTLAGNTITGEWYSRYAKKGWYRYVGRVRPDGGIEQSQSDDPIRSNLKTAVLTRKP